MLLLLLLLLLLESSSRTAVVVIYRVPGPALTLSEVFQMMPAVPRTKIIA